MPTDYEMREFERRLLEVERKTQNGHSPIVLARQIAAVEKKVENLDEKVDDRFDNLASRAAWLAMFIIVAMGVAVAIVGLVVHG